MNFFKAKSLNLAAFIAVTISSSAFSEELKPVSVRISKEEIAAASSPQFIKTRDLSDVLVEKIKLLATTITARQGGSNRKLVEISDAAKQMSREAYLGRLGILHFEGQAANKVDGDAVRVHLLGQTRKSTEVKFKEAFPIVDRIRQGVSFNYSFNKKKSSNVIANRPKIRYGLVAKDILPATAPSVASIGNFNDNELLYSRPATVVYGIEKLDEDTTTYKVFKPYTAQEINPEIGSPISTAEEIFRRPSTDLAFKFEAANSEDSVSDKVEGGALPGAKITISQVDGLLSVQLVTTSRLGKDTLTYDTRLPLYGEASITRKFDDKFQTIQTSAVNLLGKPSAPKLNIHHLKKEEKFKAELLVKKPLIEWGVAVEPRQYWAPGKKVGEHGDRMSISIVNNF